MLKITTIKILYLSVSDPCLGLNLESVILARNQVFDGALPFRGVELAAVVRNEGLALLGRKSELNDETGDHAVRFQSRNFPSGKEERLKFVLKMFNFKI